MVKKDKYASSSSQMDINKIFLEAITKLKKSEVSISKIRSYILKHHGIDIMNKLKDLKMQTRNQLATISSHNSKKNAFSTMSSKAKIGGLKTVNLLKQSKDKANPNDKTKEKNGSGKGAQKKGGTKVKAVATVLGQNSKKGVISAMPTKANTEGLKNVKEVKEVGVQNEVGTSSMDAESSVVEVEKVLKVEKSIESNVTEKKLTSVPETMSEDKKNGDEKDKKNTNENSEENTNDSEEAQQENDSQMEVE